MTRAEVTAVVDAFIKTVIVSVADGDNVKLRGLGVFSVSNPENDSDSGNGRILTFRASRLANQVINGGTE